MFRYLNGSPLRSSVVACADIHPNSERAPYNEWKFRRVEIKEGKWIPRGLLGAPPASGGRVSHASAIAQAAFENIAR